MWYKDRDRVWNQYIRNIGATDGSSARFLELYMKRISISQEYVNCLEVYDLQKYKIIKHPGKVRAALREKKNTPFIFVACRN